MERIMEKAPRIRLAEDIDLTKADKDCIKCKGCGISEYRKVKDEHIDQVVPVICACVTRNNGIKYDIIDEILIKAYNEIENGQFAENTSKDILSLGKINARLAVDAMKRDLEQEKFAGIVLDAVKNTIEKVEEGLI